MPESLTGRAERAEDLSYVLWVETPRAERLRRGIERDGSDARADWEHWMAAEDAHYRRDPTHTRADLVIDGCDPKFDPRFDPNPD